MPDGTEGQIHADERLDDLQCRGYRILQKRNSFCFGMDAVFLTGFAKVFKGESVLDLGTGTGVIPILLSAKTAGRHFAGLEIQPEMAHMAARSAALNGLQGRVVITEGDIREASRLYGRASFDVVTANPPYMRADSGIQNPDPARAAARHEILCTLEDVVRETALVLKHGGRFYMVHRPQRLSEIVNALAGHGLEPKRLRFVHTFRNREANLVLAEAVRGGKAGLKVEPPMIVYERPGIYTRELRETYGF